MTQGMPDRLWVASATRGYLAATYQLVGGEIYIRSKMADKLAEALERLIDWAAEGHYGHLSPDAYLAQDKARGDARAALKAYREGV